MGRWAGRGVPNAVDRGAGAEWVFNAETQRSRDAEEIGGRRRRPMIHKSQPRMNANEREWAPPSMSGLRNEALALASYDAQPRCQGPPAAARGRRVPISLLSQELPQIEIWASRADEREGGAAWKARAQRKGAKAQRLAPE